MANTAKLDRPWTHMFSDERALLLSPDFRRKKSVSTTAGHDSSASSSAAAALSIITSTTAPITPPIPSVSTSLHGPWEGTFLESEELPQQAESSVQELSPPPAQLHPQPQRQHGSKNSRNSLDSFISIVDDPFFQRYHSISSDWLGDDADDAELLAPSPHIESSSQDATRHEQSFSFQGSQPRNRDSLIITDPSWASPPPIMEAVNIAVIGANGVGKSAFVQRALRLNRPPTSNINAIRLDVESIPHVVALIELDLEYFDVSPNQRISWPKQINGHMVPRIDGALILYDVMNKESIRDLPHTLSALSISGLPTMLVATKCDNPENMRQINANGMATVFPSILADFKTSANVPASTRDCLQSIVLASVFNRKGSDKESYTRRRAASSAAHLDTPPDSTRGRQPSERSSSKHSRASSDLSLLRGAQTGSADRESFYRTQNSRSPRIEYPSIPQNASSLGNEMSDEKPAQTVQGMLRSPGVRLDAGASFLDVDESDAESFRYSDDVPILQRNDELNTDRPSKMTGTSFKELVDRLLAPAMNRADMNFGDVFLCLYRKFVPPNELLSTILERFEQTWEDKASHYLERTATQFRIVEVVARWISMYPGDFARPSTRQKLEDLVEELTSEPVFAVASQQLRDHMEQDVVEDDDTEWARSDEPSAEDPSTADTTDGETTPTGGAPRGSDSLTSAGLKSLQLDDSHSTDQPTPSENGSGLGVSMSQSQFQSQFQFHSCEDYEREAASLVPMATLPLNKFRYHIFMDQNPDDMADEITRIDWIMFSSIRIRDLVRHVSLSLHEKERCKSLANVNRMISHFNHVAKWVANMILIRDKAKHRAPCMQKFMLIALRLRQLNNYNGLAAVLAGINGTAIHRLAQTRALVDADIQKRFARLGLLMSTQKSHFAYRLAWENSPLPRIPFIPLHRRDLVSAEEGSRTFVGPDGDRINWKKFEILGEVLLPIMKSQGTPYPNLKRHDISRELIMDCRMPSDDERSVQVEPTAGPADSLKKKFPWLPK
ncbi:Ras guanyl-nucleotide exchange factor [Grosmannia clavigera kw1407]|uniref:Ras guanyl-nucleotide exchange factor n=1 Tax=Grosmannia clavigera (strain kw1407 / UAMH 11150) TaxID=655863 RepID=F0XDF9_GROCL|nr:Ras guanyl-nucleotide exchange factor [Grosmannia clavigera kw1407]EFX03973.1 Ras guanyl-nucleotide exchange factor [Grosmannia clavigera kw1407]